MSFVRLPIAYGDRRVINVRIVAPDSHIYDPCVQHSGTRRGEGLDATHDATGARLTLDQCAADVDWTPDRPQMRNILHSGHRSSEPPTIQPWDWRSPVPNASHTALCHMRVNHKTRPPISSLLAPFPLIHRRLPTYNSALSWTPGVNHQRTVQPKSSRFLYESVRDALCRCCMQPVIDGSVWEQGATVRIRYVRYFCSDNLRRVRVRYSGRKRTVAHWLRTWEEMQGCRESDGFTAFVKWFF